MVAAKKRADASREPAASATTLAAARPPLGAKPSAARKKKLHLRARELMRFQCHGLELDIMNLKQEIATLEVARRLLYARSLNRADDACGSFMKTIHQFYKLLRHGFNDIVLGEDARPLDARQFMRASFTDALAVGDAPPEPHGRDHLVMHLIHMTALTGAPNVQLLESKVQSSADSRVTVIVQTKCSSPLGIPMLEAKFAHATMFPELCEKLLGRYIEAYGEARYEFDTRTGLITMADLQVDHGAAILELVDSPQDLEILLSGTGREGFANAVDRATTEKLSYIEEITDDEPVAPTGGNHSPQQVEAVSAMSMSFLLSSDDSNVSESEDDIDVASPPPQHHHHYELPRAVRW